MTRASHPALERDPFRAARDEFETTMQWLASSEAPMDHSALETGLEARGNRILRAAYQAYLDRQSALERTEAQLRDTPAGVVVRARTRQLESTFGRVRLSRLGHKAADTSTRFPLDERLNLPADTYSHPLRRRMAEEVRRGSWEQAIESVERTTAAHVPKRQAEEITVRAAQDVDVFYAERRPPANDLASANALQVLSCDSKGITMLPESLRDATRKAAASAASTAVRGDPMAEKKLRKHDKRMAVVTAVWEQERAVRTADEIVENMKASRTVPHTKRRLPKPQNKRVSATVVKNQTTAIAEMFDEATRRDPTHARTTVVLVDGEERQIEAIQDEAKRRSMNIRLVVDVIHVLHYLWLAGFAIRRKNHGATEAWVANYLVKLLTRPALDVVAAIRQSATLRGLTEEEREPVEKCANYLLKNSQYIRYRDFLAEGFPIATGVIEGACRHLVQDRLGITGARWHLAGAEAVLHLRAVHSSGDWNDYWAFHLAREAQRNYARAA